MSNFVVVCLVLALVAGAVGWSGLAAGATLIAKLLFVVFLLAAGVAVVVRILRQP